jgi:dUTP pyrophosphatase
MTLTLAVKRAPGAAELPLPAYQTEGSAGLDLRAEAFDFGGGSAGYACDLAPGKRVLALTGLHVAVPEGHVGLICPRSGLALHHGITLLNAPGVLDADYRGEVGVVLVNHGSKPFLCESGMRVAQLVIVPCPHAELAVVDELPATGRGSGGFGSTGVSDAGAGSAGPGGSGG